MLTYYLRDINGQVLTRLLLYLENDVSVCSCAYLSGRKTRRSSAAQARSKKMTPESTWCDCCSFQERGAAQVAHAWHGGHICGLCHRIPSTYLPCRCLHLQTRGLIATALATTNWRLALCQGEGFALVFI